MSNVFIPPAVPNDVAWNLEITTFYVAASLPLELWQRVLAYFINNEDYIATKIRYAKASVKIRMQGDSTRNGFVAKVKLYSVHRGHLVYAVEWQRRSGCSLSNYDAFDRFQAHFTNSVL